MQTRPLILIGGGGHSRVLVGLLQLLGAEVRGIVTSNPELVGTDVLEVPVLGLEGKTTLDPSEVTLVNGVGNRPSREGSGIGPRAALYRRYRALGFDFAPIISPHAFVQRHVSMGEGVQVMAGAVVQPGAIIGENVIINTRASIDHDVVIAPHAHIAPGAVLCGNVSVGEETHIGAGAIIIQGIRIGAGAVIGAGAIVTHHVPDGMMVRSAASEQTKLLGRPAVFKPEA